jgi:hypothetical protein
MFERSWTHLCGLDKNGEDLVGFHANRASDRLLSRLSLNLFYSHLLIALCHGHKPFNFLRWLRDERCPLSPLDLSINGV